jgi:hypothetical protein
MWFLFARPDGSTCLLEARRAMPEINAEIRGIAGSASTASGYWRVVGRSLGGTALEPQLDAPCLLVARPHIHYRTAFDGELVTDRFGYQCTY